MYRYRVPALAGVEEDEKKRGLAADAEARARSAAQVRMEPAPVILSPKTTPWPVVKSPAGLMQRNFTARALPEHDTGEPMRPDWMVPGFPYQGFRGLGSAYASGPTLQEVDDGAVLQSGMKGSAVQWMQEKLLAAGMNLGKGGADGLWGPDTQKAVEAFKTARGVGNFSAMWRLLRGTSAQAQPDGAVAMVVGVALLGGLLYSLTKRG
jgi:hypothetical protein